MTVSGKLPRPDLIRSFSNNITLILPPSGKSRTWAGPRILAIHFRGAGIPGKAFQYAVEAAHQAEAALAPGGAIEFYRYALEALPDAMPESLERNKRELGLWQSVWVILLLTKGNAAPEMFHTNERLAELAQKTGVLSVNLQTPYS